jgi:peptide/nickel transport system ATP-binding protein
MTALIAVEDLQVRFGRGRSATTVLHGVGLALQVGESLAVVGASGSGKTTLARAIAGLVKPGAGRITWQGTDVTHMSFAERRRRGVAMAMVFQDPQSSLDPRQRVWAIVSEADWISGERRAHVLRERAAALLAAVALPADCLDRFPHALSGGQRQRVAIARALCADPQLLILDEPTSALDVTVQAQVLDLLAGLRAERGMSYLFVSHDLHVVQRVSDRVLVMHQGRVVETGSTAQVLAAPAEDYTRKLVAATPSMHRRIDLATFAPAAASATGG